MSVAHGMRVAVSFVICLVAGWGPSGAQSKAEIQEREVRTWASTNYQAVSEGVFGAPTDQDGLTLDAKWVVTVRISPAFDSEPESQFSLTRFWNGKVSLAFTRLRSSLGLQLQTIYRNDPTVTPQRAVSLVHVDRLAVTQTEFPALPAIASAFEKIRSPIAMENALRMDSREYRIWLDAGSQQVYLDLLGPESGESEQPVIAWVEKTRRKVDHEFPVQSPSARH